MPTQHGRSGIQPVRNTRPLLPVDSGSMNGRGRLLPQLDRAICSVADSRKQNVCERRCVGAAHGATKLELVFPQTIAAAGDAPHSCARGREISRRVALVNSWLIPIAAPFFNIASHLKNAKASSRREMRPQAR